MRHEWPQAGTHRILRALEVSLRSARMAALGSETRLPCVSVCDHARDKADDAFLARPIVSGKSMARSARMFQR